MAVNHANPLQITTVSNVEANALFHSWSTDGGRTWQHNLIANGDSLGFACCDAQLASDDFGNIFLTYLSSDISIKNGDFDRRGRNVSAARVSYLAALWHSGDALEKSGRHRPIGRWRLAFDRRRRGQRLDFMDIF